MLILFLWKTSHSRSWLLILTPPLQKDRLLCCECAHTMKEEPFWFMASQLEHYSRDSTIAVVSL